VTAATISCAEVAVKEKDQIGCCVGVMVTIAAILVVVPIGWALVEYHLLSGPYDDLPGLVCGFGIGTDQEAELYFICGILVIVIVVLFARIATRKKP
jgi:hypothetical protein